MNFSKKDIVVHNTFNEQPQNEKPYEIYIIPLFLPYK